MRRRSLRQAAQLDGAAGHHTPSAANDTSGADGAEEQQQPQAPQSALGSEYATLSAVLRACRGDMHGCLEGLKHALAIGSTDGRAPALALYNLMSQHDVSKQYAEQVKLAEFLLQSCEYEASHVAQPRAGQRAPRHYLAVGLGALPPSPCCTMRGRRSCPSPRDTCALALCCWPKSGTRRVTPIVLCSTRSARCALPFVPLASQRSASSGSSRLRCCGRESTTSWFSCSRRAASSGARSWRTSLPMPN